MTSSLASFIVLVENLNLFEIIYSKFLVVIQQKLGRILFKKEKSGINRTFQIS